MRSLAADGPRRFAWGLPFVVALLGAWGAWFALAPVALYEVSDAARLEITRAVHPVEVPVAGRVIATWLVVVGREVVPQAVLLRVDR